MIAVVGGQNLRLVVAGPESVYCRAPLPVEFQVVVARRGRVAQGGLTAAGDIGVHREGVAIEEDLVAEIVGVDSRDPAAMQPESGIEGRRGSRWRRRIEDKEPIWKRIRRSVQHERNSGEIHSRDRRGGNTGRCPDVCVNPDDIVRALRIELVPRDWASANRGSAGRNYAYRPGRALQYRGSFQLICRRGE